MDQKRLEQLRRSLERLADRSDPDPELEYDLTRLSSALTASAHLSYRSLHPRQHRPELLAQIDALLAQTDEIRERAEHAREVMLRQPPDDKTPGFTE